MMTTKLLRGISLIALLLCSVSLWAERYKVTEDGFGNYEVEKVEKAEEPVQTTRIAVDAQADVQDEGESAGDKLPSDRQNVTASKNHPADSDVKSRNNRIYFKGAEVSRTDMDDGESAEPFDGPSDSIATETSAQSDADIPSGMAAPTIENSDPESTGDIVEPKKLSIFEQKYLEAEAKERSEILQRLKANQGGNAFDATTVNEAEFVDGDLLLEGKAAPRDRQPYFVTLDSDGQQRVTFYSPEMVKRAFDEKYNSDKLELTAATIYRAGAEQEQVLRLQQRGADPAALAIFGLDGQGSDDFFSNFSRRCCESIPNRYTPIVELGRSHFFELGRDDLPYRFPYGDSRYLLLRLPALDQSYPLRLRSFVREYTKKDIEHGVFFPQLVLLDAQKRPLRIIVDPLLKFEPETWTRYGYLEGIFRIERNDEEAGERFLLITTTPDALKRASVYQSDDQDVEITHMDFGSFEVEVVTEAEF